MSIQLIVGLGNPGPNYENTRHNAGAWWIQSIAKQYNTYLQAERGFLGEMCKFRASAGQDVILLFPTTFMNRSGQSVGAIAKFYKIAPESILVAHDELDLAPGVAKLKQGGGHAGHNGLRDIIAHLGTPNFWRLRIGIGHPRTLNLNQEVADFVLHRPRQEEQIDIERSLAQASHVLPQVFKGDFTDAMKQLHTPVA